MCTRHYTKHDTGTVNVSHVMSVNSTMWFLPSSWPTARSKIRVGKYLCRELYKVCPPSSWFFFLPVDGGEVESCSSVAVSSETLYSVSLKCLYYQINQVFFHRWSSPQHVWMPWLWPFCLSVKPAAAIHSNSLWKRCPSCCHTSGFTEDMFIGNW